MQLSVVIPAYEAERTLARAISSAREAGATQIIVVDDGSVDRTSEIAQNLHCTVVRQKNSGAAASRRAGFDRATGEYVVLLDADDTLIREGIERAIDVLAGASEVQLVIGAMSGLTATGEKVQLPVWPEGVTLESLLTRGYAPAAPAAVVWRRGALSTAFSEQTDLPAVWPRYAEDYELLVRAAAQMKLGVIDTVTCEYSMSGGKSSTAPRSSIQCAELIRRHYASILGISIRHRGRRQIEALVLLRRASELPGRSGMLARTQLRISATLISPELLLAKLLRKPQIRRQRQDFLAWSSIRNAIRSDRLANPRDPKAQAVLLFFRLCQYAMADLSRPRRSSLPLIVAYRFWTEFVLGLELRPKTLVGPGLTIYHGYGLVVNDHAVIGAGVVLRNGVTIGHRSPGKPCPVLGDGVEVGANASIIGAIEIGAGARIGAGAVVVKSVAAGDVVVGNPARSVNK